MPEGGQETTKGAKNANLENMAPFDNVGPLRGVSEAAADDLGHAVNGGWEGEI